MSAQKWEFFQQKFVKVCPTVLGSSSRGFFGGVFEVCASTEGEKR